jgi:hypothetical protein
VGALHVEAEIFEPPQIRSEIVGYRAVVDQATAGGEERSPASEVIPRILRVQKGH